MSLGLPFRADATFDLAYVLTQPYHATGVSYNPSPHLALDMSGHLGQAVYAAESGVVFASSWDGDGWAIGGGNVVILDHTSAGNRRFRSLYAHLSRRVVSRGQFVMRGQLIGYADTTGRASGPHLHFAFGPYAGLATDGGYRYEDPYRYMLAHRFENGGVSTGALASSFHASEYIGENGPTNVRAGASTSYGIIYTASRRTMLGFRGAVTGQSVGGSRTWDRVFVPAVGRTGYVHGSLGRWVP